jgi:hypothetical protein
MVVVVFSLKVDVVVKGAGIVDLGTIATEAHLHATQVVAFALVVLVAVLKALNKVLIILVFLSVFFIVIYYKKDCK